MSNQKFSQYFEGLLFFENDKTFWRSHCSKNVIDMDLVFAKN